MKAVFCSEGIYSATLIVNLGVYSAASSAVYTIMDILPSLVVSAMSATSTHALSDDTCVLAGHLVYAHHPTHRPRRGCLGPLGKCGDYREFICASAQTRPCRFKFPHPVHAGCVLHVGYFQ